MNNKTDKAPTATSACPLVMVHWVDSAQPISAWSFLAQAGFGSVVQCVSVGWLIHDDDDVKALAPNMGDIGTASVQVSGVIRIPTGSITGMTELAESSISSSGDSS